MAVLLAADCVGLAHIGLDQAADLGLQGRAFVFRQRARLLRRLFREADDHVDHWLKVLVTEHDGAEHDLFGQLLRFGFDHQHGFARSRYDELELRLGHLVELRIEHEFIVDEADARCADRTHEGSAGERERSGSRHHRNDVGIVFEIVREHVDGDLRIAAPAVGEQRTDRTVDQARDQRVAFRRTAFALEVAARDAARSVVFFLVVDGEREKIEPGLRLFRRDDRGDHRRLSVRSEYRAVCLTRDPAGF